MEQWKVVLIEPVREMLAKIARYIPNLLAALIIIIVGWLVAGALKNVVIRVLKLLQLDTAIEKAKLGDILRRGGVKQTVSELIGALVYWLIMLVVFMIVLNALGMTVAATLLDKVILYVPNVIAAIFILTLGVMFSGMAETVVRTASSNAGIKQANFLGQVTQTVIIIFVILVTLEQLNIASTILNLTLNIILASIGLAFAIAVGLGAKDVVGKLIKDFIDSFSK